MRVCVCVRISICAQLYTYVCDHALACVQLTASLPMYWPNHVHATQQGPAILYIHCVMPVISFELLLKCGANVNGRSLVFCCTIPFSRLCSTE